MKKKVVTIHDVAKHAGVVPSTVSKYLNKTPYVSEKTQKKIQKSIDELKFEPNSLAQSFAKQETKYIGIIVPSITNAYYPDLVETIEVAAAEKGYHVILANTRGDSEEDNTREAERELKLARQLGRNRVDGLIFSSITNDSNQINELLDEGYQFIMASRHLEEVNTDYVVIDAFEGAKMAVDHLAQLGHKKIGHIGGSQTIHQFRDRYAGFQHSLNQNNLIECLDWVLFGAPTVQGGYRLGMQLITKPNRPTAVFVGNDTLALGLLEACDNYGLKVPDDLAIVAFDNISYSRLARVPLTTVDSRIGDIGRLAVEILVEKLQKAQSQTQTNFPSRIVLKPSLVIRRSCGS